MYTLLYECEVGEEVKLNYQGKNQKGSVNKNMEKKAIFTNTYLLQSSEEDKKGFGYAQGFSYLPNYNTEIKVYIRNDKFKAESDIDNMQLLILDSAELE